MSRILINTTADPFSSDENMERLRRSARDMDAVKGAEHDWCPDTIKRGLEEAIAYERGELDANTNRITVPTPEKQEK